ncbi:MAG: protein-glutamate O-methyltransferase CheR [Polyangiaceae bacterium]|nr:protein-glutamate O-methyltransferase CheR [Polyangiaceae bacterium]
MNAVADPSPHRLRVEEFRLLRDLFRERAGLQFGDESLFGFDRRLGERVAALGLGGFAEYYRYLRFDPRGSTEVEQALDLLTTKETYFFRQSYQLDAFARELLPRLAAQASGRRRLTLWSAGCSTGEEAYTLAILACESGLFEGWDLRIVGSDISRTNVAHARRGVYRESSFRTTSKEMRRAYFDEREDGWHVRDSIRRLCHFGQLNLLDGTRTAIVGRVDAVFCRNVLIYFDAFSRRRVIDHLYERLVPGGYLLLGHSESLLNVSTAFELVHLTEDLVYRRPMASERRSGSPPR